jgi:hypothetical protein
LSTLLVTVVLLQIGVAQNVGAVTGIVRGADGKPAAQVRVYATPAGDATQITGLEGLTQTDAAGRYRLELQPGRYYVASGSVTVPTYYPGTPNIAAARAVTVTAGSLVEAIDFGSFVAPGRTLVAPAPGTAELSGVIRYPNGTPAAGIRVVAASSSLRLIATTDSTGRYRLNRLPADAFSIVAGFSDAHTFYPGTPDEKAATRIATTPTTKIDTLDFVIPRISGITVSGQVRTPGASALQANIRLIRNQPLPPPSSLAITLSPSTTASRELSVDGSGRFEFRDVMAGTYALEASIQGVASQAKTIVVAAQPISDLEFVFPIARLSGRLLMEDGSPHEDPLIFEDAVASSLSDPRKTNYTTFAFAKDGTLSGLIAADEYRFYLRVLPEEYEIASMAAGPVDLLKETMKTTSDAMIDVDIRIRRRSAPNADVRPRVTGVVVDSVSGLPAAADRIRLCCLSSGPAERLSAPLRNDGSFVFTAVPDGKYTPRLQVKPEQVGVYLGGASIEVENSRPTELRLLSAFEFRQVTVTVEGSPLPGDARPSVMVSSILGHYSIRAERNSYGSYQALVPVGDRYGVSVSNLPEGYVVHSTGGPLEVPPVAARPNALSPTTVTIGKVP